jgi:hypothetical protein
MRIEIKRPLPSNEQLIDLLKQRFSDGYSYRLFGLGNKKTVLIKKSPFVGAQVSIRENEVTVLGTPPSMLTGNFLFLLSWIGVDVILGLLFRSQLKSIEFEVTRFLKDKLG